MKQLKWVISLLLFSAIALGGATRILDGAQITNGAATLTLPTSTDTLVGRDTTDTLTNKSLDFSSNTATNIDLTSAVTGALPIANGGTGQTTAQAAIDALVPTQTGNSGEFLTTDGTNVSWAPVTAGDSWGTPVDADIIPDADSTWDLGSNSVRFAQAYVDQVTTSFFVLQSSGNQARGNLIPDASIPSGINADVLLRAQQEGGEVAIVTQDGSSTNPSGGIYLETGNQVGTVNSGGIFLRTGNSAAATVGSIVLDVDQTTSDGSILFQDGSQGTAGHVWTSQDANGTGAWAAPSAPAPTISGSTGTPNSITAGGGITFSGTNYSNIHFVQGSGGPVDITVDPQISAGTNVGQKLTLIGQSDTNTLKLDHGTGLSLNGSATLAKDSSIELMWDGTLWTELSRR